MHEDYSVIDTLNSWVRSKSHWHWSVFGDPKHAIYEWKRLLIRRAIAAGDAELKAIRLSLKCRDCGGTGRYTDSYGFTHDHCYRCFSKGTVTLQFLVTSMYGFSWHTPQNLAYGLVSGGFFETSELSCDWEPNQHGKNLDPLEVIRLLNLAEEELPRPGKRWVRLSDCESMEADNFKYLLYLGEAKERCEFCGGVDQLLRYHTSRAWLRWTAKACRFCSIQTEGSIWERFQNPAIATHPEILKWMGRRGL